MSDLDKLAADLGINMDKLVKPIMGKAGMQMKKGAKADAPKGKHVRGYPRTIEYQLKDGGTAVEMGPRDAGQGLLSHVLEYGGAHSPPHPHIIPQLDREAPVTVEYIADAIVDLLGGSR